MRRLDQPHGRGEFFRSLGRLLAGFVAEQAETALTSTSPRLLRPPGALDELAFLTTCTRCDRCMLACPQGAILTAGSGLALGTPYLVPRALPCFLCEGLPCVKACQEGALVWPERRLDGKRIEGPQAVRMGLARLDAELCLAFPRSHGPAQACQACHDRCPFPGEALRMTVPEEGGTPRPEVGEAHCTGCGLCESACPEPRAAIRVDPR